MGHKRFFCRGTLARLEAFAHRGSVVRRCLSILDRGALSVALTLWEHRSDVARLSCSQDFSGAPFRGPTSDFTVHLQSVRASHTSALDTPQPNSQILCASLLFPRTGHARLVLETTPPGLWEGKSLLMTPEVSEAYALQDTNTTQTAAGRKPRD